MHTARQALTKKMPITRKGTKYIVRASSHVEESVPVLIAVRDILKLAVDAREVKAMIKSKALKMNGRNVVDFKEAIKLFNIFEADKAYRLILMPTGKFALEETKAKERMCKVTNRRLVEKGKIQLNLHDGTNVLSNDKINVGDTVYLDFSGKIKKHVKLEKGSEVFVFKGKYTGLTGKVSEMKDGMVTIKFKGKDESSTIPSGGVIAQ